MQNPGVPTSSILRVGILADTIDRPGGIGRYSHELVAALARRDDVRLVVGAHAPARDLVHELAGDRLDSMVTIPDRGQVGTALWERHASGRVFAAAGAELVHSTKHLVPRGGLPTVLTVHDVMTITRAHESSPAKRLFLPRQYRASLTSATGLVSTSQATADRLGQLDPRWQAKTLVAPNGLSRTLLDTRSEPVPGLESTRFALVVGDLAPRKNVAMLLDIWPEASVATAGCTLVVLGNPGPHSDETVRRLESLRADGIAVWLRGAGDGALRWCYEHATVVLFPSLEEGFGFPLLEALTFHAPVIASTDPALMEVAPGSELVVHLDATDPAGWLREITRAATVPRGPQLPPALPPGAATWDENVDKVVSRYRTILCA
jgi:glycosyltransferase involved in cell wall biosynthesis